MNAREAAFLALESSLKGQFISSFLQKWQDHIQPPQKDFRFAYEIAYGSAKMALALDYIASHFSTNKKLSLKVKERALVRTAVYQFFFMDKVPSYAIVDESIKISKKYFHSYFVSFLHALLRNMLQGSSILPKGHTPEDLSVRLSYPLLYVQELLADYGHEKTEKLLNIGNQPPVLMARKRGTGDKFFTFKIIKDSIELTDIAQNRDYYIQNSTPPKLIETQARFLCPPKRVLDLCASPGGKILAVHDLFPHAILHANDISDHKIDLLRKNMEKYGISVKYSTGPGESFESNQKFDLIILDVPCSNSGVLNKRPEARWRMCKENWRELRKLQLSLIQKAQSFLSPIGKIWYMTCSILKYENERLIQEACAEGNLKAAHEITVLPDTEGNDGGFACTLFRFK